MQTLAKKKKKKKKKLRRDINSSTEAKGYFDKMWKHAKKLVKHQRTINKEKLYIKIKKSMAICQRDLQHKIKKNKKKPTFSKEEALNYFYNSFSSEHSKYSSLPDWVNTAFQPPNITEEFNLSPVIPSIIKILLKSHKKPSAPGMDKITYGQLWNLPTCHHFLGTLYN